MSMPLQSGRTWSRTAVISLISGALSACNTMPLSGGESPSPSSAPTGGCERLPMSNTSKALIGGAIGATVGYMLGNAAGGHKGRNRTTGALGGALVGALASSAFKNDIDVEEQADGSVKLKVPGSIMFASGQYSLSPAFQSTLTNVTTSVKKYCGITVRVVGHTDSVGALQANMVLSEKRARSVVNHMQAQGFDPTRLQSEGHGPNEPIASNLDEAGRQQNRRVEIFMRPPAG